MGLLLGGSVITVIELLDFVCYNIFRKLVRVRQTARISFLKQATIKQQQPHLPAVQ